MFNFPNLKFVSTHDKYGVELKLFDKNMRIDVEKYQVSLVQNQIKPLPFKTNYISLHNFSRRPIILQSIIYLDQRNQIRH